MEFFCEQSIQIWRQSRTDGTFCDANAGDTPTIEPIKSGLEVILHHGLESVPLHFILKVRLNSDKHERHESYLWGSG